LDATRLTIMVDDAEITVYTYANAGQSRYFFNQMAAFLSCFGKIENPIAGPIPKLPN
jgi:hypothetical protein